MHQAISIQHTWQNTNRIQNILLMEWNPQVKQEEFTNPVEPQD